MRPILDQASNGWRPRHRNGAAVENSVQRVPQLGRRRNRPPNAEAWNLIIDPAAVRDGPARKEDDSLRRDLSPRKARECMVSIQKDRSGKAVGQSVLPQCIRRRVGLYVDHEEAQSRACVFSVKGSDPRRVSVGNWTIGGREQEDGGIA